MFLTQCLHNIGSPHYNYRRCDVPFRYTLDEYKLVSVDSHRV